MSKLKDERGNKYGLLTVIDFAPKKNNKIYYKCKCECGNETIVSGTNLRTGQVKSCGKCIYNNQPQDLTNQIFGVWKVLKEASPIYNKRAWLCECQNCKRQHIITGTNLKTGHTKSCECIQGSYGEFVIRTLLQQHNISFIEQYIVPGFKLSTEGIPKFDFAIQNKYNDIICLIEFDGEQHYVATGGWNDISCNKITKQRDNEKTQYCKIHHIPLVRIPYFELSELTIVTLLQKIQEAQEVLTE